MEAGAVIAGLCFFSVLFFSGLMAIVLGIREIRKLKSIRNTHTSKIRYVTPGKVEVNGIVKAIPGTELISPISREPCVIYHTEVSEPRGSGEDRHMVVIKRYFKFQSFLLEDYTGIIKVDPRGGDRDILNSISHHAFLAANTDPRVRAFMDRHDLDTTGPFGVLNSDYVITEKILPAGRELYVLGDAVDLPPDKRLWGLDKLNPLTIMRGDELIISVKGEKGVSRKYLWKGLAYLGIGSFLLVMIVVLFFGFLPMI